MQVIKFGGSSVANAENIKKVMEITRQKMENGRTLVVVSALGGVTDLLLKIGSMAATGEDGYKNVLQDDRARWTRNWQFFDEYFVDINFFSRRQLCPVQPMWTFSYKRQV